MSAYVLLKMSINRFLKSLRPQQSEHHILMSLLIYSLGGFFYISVSTAFGNVVQLVGAFYYLWIVLNAHKETRMPVCLRLCLVMLSIWTFVLVIRMFFIDTNLIILRPFQKAVMDFFIGFRVWPMFLIFIPYVFGYRHKIDMSYFVKMGLMFAIFFIIYYPFAFYNMVNFQFSLYSANEEGNYQDFISNSTLGIGTLCPCFILLFWKKYMSFKVWFIILVACVANLFITIHMARRGTTVLTLIYFVLLWYLYTAQSRLKGKLRMLAMATVMLASAYMVFVSLSDSFFSLIVERAEADTRSGVERSFYKYFSSQADWLFGRGLLGTYYDEIFGEQRFSIETGYLFIILRAGLLYLIPYVMLLMVSGIKGYFKSNNLFIKSIAIFMLMSVLELYPWGYPTFSFKFFIIWLGVIMCNSKYFLSMSDQEIQNVLFVKPIIKKR